MQTKDKESMKQQLQELEAKLDEASMEYRELKEKVKACTDEDSDEAFELGLAEFNLSNYMIMLDDRISMIRSQIEEEK
ncbi:MAG: hypothetical protein IKV05_00805 [Bacteroidales bacterium]|nr:hypothetical protein [Bacteroidales bacterium]